MSESPQTAGEAALAAPTPLELPPAAEAFRFPDRAARHWLLASVVWLTVVDLFGLVLATEFVTPEAFGNTSWLAFSRIRPSHVSGVILAWLTMMYFGALFYMLPRLVGTRGMWSERLGPVGRGVDAEAFRLEPAGEEREDAGLVLGDQDSHGLRRRPYPR